MTPAPVPDPRSRASGQSVRTDRANWGVRAVADVYHHQTCTTREVRYGQGTAVTGRWVLAGVVAAIVVLVMIAFTAMWLFINWPSAWSN
jgi:hypothetical protein